MESIRVIIIYEPILLRVHNVLNIRVVLPLYRIEHVRYWFVMPSRKIIMGIFLVGHKINIICK